MQRAGNRLRLECRCEPRQDEGTGGQDRGLPGAAPAARVARAVSASAPGEPFERRVRALRDSWEERRQVRQLSHAQEFSAQFRLLATLHAWAVQAIDDIGRVYGPGVSVTLSPARLPSEAGAFTITVQERFTATFTLMERRGTPGSWRLDVQVSDRGTGNGSTPAGPERRHGGWTRARFEEIVLSLLGAYERAQGEELTNAG